MPSDLDANALLINPQAVRLSLSRLIATKVHPNFAGFLCITREACKKNSTTSLKPNFKSFFDQFFKTDGAPDDKPYVMPFAESRGADWSPFFNRNVAGSYAPSSLRPVSPLRQVVEVSGSRGEATYSLVTSYADKARSYLLFDKPIGIWSLAIFLYRDYGFHLMREGIEGLVSTFREEFGFRPNTIYEKLAYDKLFEDDSSAFQMNELLIKTTLS